MVTGSPMGMVTGSPTGTYIRFGREIAEVGKRAGLEIVVKESEGSLDNIRRLVRKENAAMGIVQSDVLGFLARSDEAVMRRIAAQLRLIFPFYNEEVHLFARRDIQRFEDLAGKRVVVGTPKSGNWLTATNLLRLLNVKPAERLELPPPEGVSEVLSGKADAMFYVAGKPVQLFANMNDLQQNPQHAALLKNVHFVPLEDPRILKEYGPAAIAPSDYAWFTTPIKTVAVQAVLISFDFSDRGSTYHRARCEQLAQLGQVVRDHLPALKQNGHPKWKEVDLEKEMTIWKRDACSQAAQVRRASPRQGDLEKELKDILTRPK